MKLFILDVTVKYLIHVQVTILGSTFSYFFSKSMYNFIEISIFQMLRPFDLVLKSNGFKKHKKHQNH